MSRTTMSASGGRRIEGLKVSKVKWVSPIPVVGHYSLALQDAAVQVFLVTLVGRYPSCAAAY